MQVFSYGDDGDDKRRDAVCFVSFTVQYCTVRISLPVFWSSSNVVIPQGVGVGVERVTRYIMIILCGFLERRKANGVIVRIWTN